MATNSLFSSDIDEKTWVDYIKKMATELKNEVNDVPVCVFHVPKSLSSARPEAFVPQLIALGPYHHFRPELYAMERYKIATANKALERYNYNKEVEELVNQLKDQAPRIRATYHKYVDVKDETLAWIMAIDSLFFLQFLHTYSENESTNFLHPSSGNHLVRSAGHKLTKDGIVRDLLMLENQVPVLALKMLLCSVTCSTSKPTPSANDEDLASLFMSFSKALLPMTLQSHASEIKDVMALQTHLLGFMYDLLVPEEKIIVTCEKSSSVLQIKGDEEPKKDTFFIKTYKGVVRTFLKLISLLIKPLKWILGLLKKLSKLNLPNFLGPLKGPLQLILGLADIGSWCSPASESDDGSPPPIIMIPSVTELYNAGVKFKGIKGGVSARNIKLEKKMNHAAIFYLPHIKLGVNSEVLMRNLVAYEAMTKSNYLIFTRYTELMRAIIDTEEDVKLLRDSKIIESDLLDDEIAHLFNGMAKSIGPTETPELDKVIKEVNRFYDNTRSVRAYRAMRKYVYSSWKIFTLMATLFVLMLMGLQTFCTVYSCPRILHTGS
ncbi:hypothetical protein UlMin_008479 [Ulmus minor]